MSEPDYKKKRFNAVHPKLEKRQIAIEHDKEHIRFSDGTIVNKLHTTWILICKNFGWHRKDAAKR